MAIYRTLEMITKYLLEAGARIFGPNDDQYPVIGMQPFSGEPYSELS